jgi:hypothetical protein
MSFQNLLNQLHENKMFGQYNITCFYYCITMTKK